MSTDNDKSFKKRNSMMSGVLVFFLVVVSILVFSFGSVDVIKEITSRIYDFIILLYVGGVITIFIMQYLGNDQAESQTTKAGVTKKVVDLFSLFGIGFLILLIALSLPIDDKPTQIAAFVLEVASFVFIASHIVSDVSQNKNNKGSDDDENVSDR